MEIRLSADMVGHYFRFLGMIIYFRKRDGFDSIENNNNHVFG